MTTDSRHKPSIADVIHLCRPRQWVKNLLVVAAPFAAGVMDEPATFVQVCLGVVAFSLAASGMYAFNDALDSDVDRHHPRKRSRPVAAGRITRSVAIGVGTVLTASGLVLAALIGPTGFVAIVALYVVTSTAYSIWLKRYALVDVVLVAFGFLLRALSGAVLVDVPASTWFLIVTTFGALFVAAGRRYSERLELEGTAADHRPALDDYAPGFLELLLGVSAAVMLLAYALWALDVQAGSEGDMWAALSLGPFTIAVLRYAQLIYLGRGGEPETLVLRDRGLQAAGALWAVMVAVAIYQPFA